MTLRPLYGLITAMIALAGSAAQANNDLLVRFKDSADSRQVRDQLNGLVLSGAQIEQYRMSNWTHIVVPEHRMGKMALEKLSQSPIVADIQPNYRLGLIHNFRLEDESKRAQLESLRNDPEAQFLFRSRKDNPDIPTTPPRERTGIDALLSRQWGMLDIGAVRAWEKQRGAEDFVVAVIDTGVDYTHEDLAPNMWKNPGETGRDAQGRDKATNGVDDDGNGYIDDVVGWDFVSNDNKPFDMTKSWWSMLLGGGNPGHGTHCAGNVAARGNNAIGIAGVAPNVKIMALRFLSENGGGTTADAMRAIEYAVKMNVKVTSNSWGSMGEDPRDGDNRALREMIQLAEQKGHLFIAAAGNGRMGKGYDNDNDSQPSYPASYPYSNIISVAAIDANDRLGTFSNWGAKTVHIGAPGVAVFSTMVNNVYSDSVLKFRLLGLDIKWDGTSMATPHVAGAAALYWSQHPNATMAEVKEAILRSAKPIPALTGKTVSGGKLNVERLMNL